MNENDLLQREPVLHLLHAQQFISQERIKAALQDPDAWLNPESTHLLTQFLATLTDHVSETKWLAHLLTDPAFNNPATPKDPTAPGAAYMPAPGRNDALPLAPDPAADSFVAVVPPQTRRTLAWIVTNPRPGLIILTYDPAILPRLYEDDIPAFWLNLARARRPDLAAEISANVIRGITSFHQILKPSDSWRSFPTNKTMEDKCAVHDISVFFATELAIYGWARHPSPTETLKLSNVLYRHLHLRESPYGSLMGSIAVRERLRDFSLADAGTESWRRTFLSILNDSADHQDSDLHILRSETGGANVLRRRYGNLEFVTGIPSRTITPFMRAVLVGTGLDPGSMPEKPKDARAFFHAQSDGRRIDLRFNLQPGMAPFNVPATIVRLLDPSTIRGGLSGVMIDTLDKNAWDFALAQTGGIIFVTGPTGSGKSRTIYSAIQTLHEQRPSASFKSVEDPVEFRLGDWFQQNQVTEELGVTFANIVRGLLRADPEVIMIGEIRDPATAKAAIDAALSGHLVITTIHVQSLASIPDRLHGLGVEPGTLSTVFRFATAQRLIGRSCPACRREVVLKDAAPILPDAIADQADSKVMVNDGCPLCKNRGLVGRFAIQEYLAVPDRDREAQNAIKNMDIASLQDTIASSGIAGLHQRALSLAQPDKVRDHPNRAVTNLGEILAL